MENPLERRSFDIGWLVGIIDGEGCFTLIKTKQPNGSISYFPAIQITNTNIEIVNKAQNILKRMGMACHFHARVTTPTGRPYYRVQVGGIKRLKRFMDAMGDLFECRREQYSLLREYVELRLSKISHSPVVAEEHEIARRLARANGRMIESSETTCQTPTPRAA